MTVCQITFYILDDVVSLTDRTIIFQKFGCMDY